MEATNTAAVDSRDDNDNLQGLTAVVTTAVAFAEKWPETYRSKVFDLAVDRLSGPSTLPTKPVTGTTVGVTPIATGGLSMVAKEVGVEARDLARAVAIDDQGKVAILGRIDGRAKADLAVQYAAVYCFIKERALNQLDTPIEELRALAKAHGAYDGPNFTAAFRRSDLLRELGEAGAHKRTYRLSAKGVEEAKALLKTIVES